jgi:hypothetical protein
VAKCKCGCGKEASKNRDYAWGHKPKGAKAKAAPAKSNGHILAHVALLQKWNAEADAVFVALPLEKKAELLAHLS